MKRLLLGMTGLAVFLTLAGTACAQKNGRGKTEVEVGGKTVTIDYGRPYLKGRSVQDLLGQLPAGGFWRLGSDSSTTFTTSGDLTFGETKVPKGVYSLWAQKEADNSWKLVFNTQHGQWGTQHNPKLDAVFVPLKETKASSPAEEVTIALAKAGEDGKFTVQWGDMELSTSFR